jgi:hypothetical protein
MRVLDLLIQDKNASWRRKATLACYLTKIARLGGYLARAKDPPPGNAVMWRGVSRLTIWNWDTSFDRKSQRQIPNADALIAGHRTQNFKLCDQV